MGQYIRRRIITTIPVILGVTFVVFMMIHLLPGDPVMMMLSEHRGGTAPGAAGAITDETYQNMREQLGIDRPLPVQYGEFLVNLFQGDLGHSFRSDRPVLEIILRNLPHTIRLAVLSLGIAVVLGLVLGTVAAVKRGTWIDGFTMMISVVGVAMPNFWLGLILMLVFSLYLGIVPSIGAGWQGIFLPAFALGFSAAAIIARLVRSSLLEVLNQDFIQAARSKGLRERRVILSHAMKNAMIPVVTVTGLQFGNLLGGTVVIETVFARPGLGYVAVNSILDRDFPVIQGVVLFAALAYVLANFLVDLIYAWLDPRIRLG